MWLERDAIQEQLSQVGAAVYLVPTCHLDAEVRADKHSWGFGDSDYLEANLAPLTGMVGSIQVGKYRLAAEQMDTRTDGHCTLDLALALSQTNRRQGACGC